MKNSLSYQLTALVAIVAANTFSGDIPKVGLLCVAIVLSALSIVALRNE